MKFHRSTIWGVLLSSASVLLWQVLLTRIYGVMLFYHFAFMVVSLAMFGITLGAMWVYLFPKHFPFEAETESMGWLSLAAGICMAAVITVQLNVPFRYSDLAPPTFYLVMTYILSSLPFVPAGAIVCLAITRDPGGVGKMYAADLAGAAIGCLLVPILLPITGGIGTVFVAATLSFAAAALLYRSKRRRKLSAILAAVVLVFAVLNEKNRWLTIRYTHQGKAPTPLYEKWNAYSRIIVREVPWGIPFGYGIHRDLVTRFPSVEQRQLEIDSGAGTPITHIDSDPRKLEFLKYDITSFAHHLRPTGNSLIIGTGGGRDILSALTFGKSAITAVEVNGNILSALNGPFGEFSGHLDRNPKVHFVNDEGRSYLSRTDERFDLIQASFVDTSAATAAGAFAFVESGLYTQEAWELFLRKLKPGGVFSNSRFNFGSSRWPVEVCRLVALAHAALRGIGVADPKRNMIVVRTDHTFPLPEKIVTLLISPTEFSEGDLAKADTVCAQLRCEVVLNWKKVTDPYLRKVFDPNEIAGGFPAFPLDISPPSDDRPFFFFHAKPADAFSGTLTDPYGESRQHVPAVRILMILCALSLFLASAIIFVPLSFRRKSFRRSGIDPFGFAYFAAIGLAFMFVEIAQIQRMSLFLGHPTYGFVVVLFSLLLFTGIGSSLPRRPQLLIAIPILLALSLFAGEWAIANLIGSPNAVRIFISIALLGIPAIAMGLALPSGMDRILPKAGESAPWYWAVNGAFSIIGSIVAMAACLFLGIQSTFWLGIAIYLIALVSLNRMRPAQDH
jgi:hypothetical protein